jgi:hypothetical protein
MSEQLDEMLAIQNELESAKRPRREHAEGWEPGVAWNGKEGVLTTSVIPGENAPNWDTVLKVWGLDPEMFEVVEPVLMNVWGDPLGTLNRQWKGKVIQKRVAVDSDVAEMISEIKKFKPRKPIVKDVGATGAGDMGTVMAAVKAQLAGKADMGLVSAAVKKALAG